MFSILGNRRRRKPHVCFKIAKKKLWILSLWLVAIFHRFFLKNKRELDHLGCSFFLAFILWKIYNVFSSSLSVCNLLSSLCWLSPNNNRAGGDMHSHYVHKFLTEMQFNCKEKVINPTAINNGNASLKFAFVNRHFCTWLLRIESWYSFKITFIALKPRRIN